MEERARIVEAQQAGLALGPLGEIHHIDHDRQLRSVELLLAAEIAHPRAAPLRRPGEIVADEQRDGRAVAPAHGPGANVGMIKLEVEALLEAEAEQAARGIEGRLDHAVELQIGLELALVEVELGLAPLLGQIAPVPGRDLEIAALARDDLLQRLLILPRARNARRPDRTRADRARRAASSPSCRRGGNGRRIHSRAGARARLSGAPFRRRSRDCRSRRRFRRAPPRRERRSRADRGGPRIAGTARCSIATG